MFKQILIVLSIIVLTVSCGNSVKEKTENAVHRGNMLVLDMNTIMVEVQGELKQESDFGEHTKKSIEEREEYYNNLRDLINKYILKAALLENLNNRDDVTFLNIEILRKNVTSMKAHIIKINLALKNLKDKNIDNSAISDTNSSLKLVDENIIVTAMSKIEKIIFNKCMTMIKQYDNSLKEQEKVKICKEKPDFDCIKRVTSKKNWIVNLLTNHNFCKLEQEKKDLVESIYEKVTYANLKDGAVVKNRVDLAIELVQSSKESMPMNCLIKYSNELDTLENYSKKCLLFKEANPKYFKVDSLMTTNLTFKLFSNVLSKIKGLENLIDKYKELYIFNVFDIKIIRDNSYNVKIDTNTNILYINRYTISKLTSQILLDIMIDNDSFYYNRKEDNL